MKFDAKVAGHLSAGLSENWAREASFYLKSMLNFVRVRSEKVKTGERLPDWLRDVVAARLRAKGRKVAHAKESFVSKHRRLTKRLSETSQEPEEIPLCDVGDESTTDADEAIVVPPEELPLPEANIQVPDDEEVPKAAIADAEESEWSRLEEVFGASRKIPELIAVDSSEEEEEPRIIYHDHGRGVMVRTDSSGLVEDLGPAYMVDSEVDVVVSKKPAAKGKPKAQTKSKAKKSGEDKAKTKAKVKTPGGLGCSKCRWSPNGCRRCKSISEAMQLQAAVPQGVDVD